MASFPTNHGVTNPTFTSKNNNQTFRNNEKKKKKITSYFSTKINKFKGQFFIFAFFIFVVAVKDN